MSSPHVWTRRILGVAALVVLDVSLTFQNVWPTPAVRWSPILSAELAVVVLIFAFTLARGRPISRSSLRWCAAAWVVLVFGRYEYVTAAALFGRELNLYFDLRFLPAVTMLLATAAPVRAIVAVTAIAILVVAALYAVLRWALGAVAALVEDPPARRVTAGLAAAVLALFIVQRFSPRVPGQDWFANPVVDVYAHQVANVVDGLRRGRQVPASPPIASSFARLQGADVLLIFVESYGAVSYERPDLARGIDPARAELARAVHDTGRDVVTAYVESPTFGGNSWLAHISLLSGIEVRDIDTSSLLMMQPRDTLVKAFDRHGYRTVAVMPGQRQLWPEGVFYGFNEIYGADKLDYHGPSFGWFAIPDQFALARLDALQADSRKRAPLFVFFPTLSTHTPFEPLPPFQPDWARMQTDQPYDSDDAARALARQPNWLNLGASYVDAMVYELRTFASYLRLHRDRDLVMILIGDHEPPAVVSGQNASWNVPVHVITSRRAIADELVDAGFRRGMVPSRPLGKMNTLLPILLRAFGEP